jgi:hypothetical protein
MNHVTECSSPGVGRVGSLQDASVPALNFIKADATVNASLVFHSAEINSWFLKISAEGKIEIHPRYTPDEATELFLKELTRRGGVFFGGLRSRAENAEARVSSLKEELLQLQKENTTLRLQALNHESENARRLQDRA